MRTKTVTGKHCSDCDLYKNPINILYGGNWRICSKRNTIKGQSMACASFEESIEPNMTMKIETKRPRLVRRK